MESLGRAQRTARGKHEKLEKEHARARRMALQREHARSRCKSYREKIQELEKEYKIAKERTYKS